MKIQAAIAFEGKEHYEIHECDLTEPGPDEILVDVKACGVCHTDASVKSGALPMPLPNILGHEGAGIVKKTGANVSHVKAGDHVVMTYGSCGSCSSCSAGQPPYCLEFAERNLLLPEPSGPPTHKLDGTPINGRFFSQSSFATHAIAQKTNTIKIDREIPFHLAGPMACGVQTGMGAVLNTLQPTAGQSIAIFGAGSVGLSAVMAAKIANCGEIIAIDINPTRLALAAELGATHTINSSELDPLAAIGEAVPSMMNYAFDSTAVPKVAELAIMSLARKGVAGFVGAPPLGTGFNVDMNLLVGFGITLRGVVEGDSIPSLFIPQMIDYYKRGQLPLDKIITTYPFAKINDAVEAAEGGRVVKAVLMMDDA